MKFKDMERLLKDNGFVLIRQSKHLIYSNGKKNIAVPHQKEINKILSKHIIKEMSLS